MRSAWKKFELSDGMLTALERKLGAKGEIFPLRSDPLLGALVSCLGLQFELGKADQDRTSHFFGIDLTKLAGENPWQTEIISFGDLIGLRAWVPGGGELQPIHKDLRMILHPLSLSPSGELNQIVIFPTLVAEAYESRGIELVVVRDWALSAFLSRNRNLNYQKTNKQEIEENIARLQITLMRKRQLAFTGTHDLGDHMLGGHASGIAASDSILEELDGAYKKAFSGKNPARGALVASYLVAVLLDDLAQPQWYGSEAHLRLARQALGLLRIFGNGADLPVIFLPQCFHTLIELVRDRATTGKQLDDCFRRFSLELQSRVDRPALAVV